MWPIVSKGFSPHLKLILLSLHIEALIPVVIRGALDDFLLDLLQAGDLFGVFVVLNQRIYSF